MIVKSGKIRNLNFYKIILWLKRKIKIYPHPRGQGSRSRSSVNQLETSAFNRDVTPVDWNKITQWKTIIHSAIFVTKD